jgi:hypothetical protein
MIPDQSDEVTPSRLRDLGAIQRAHDVLWAEVTGDVPFVLDEHSRPLARVALDVLCWVLHHDHSDGFPKTLATIEQGLVARGYQFRRTGGRGSAE